MTGLQPVPKPVEQAVAFFKDFKREKLCATICDIKLGHRKWSVQESELQAQLIPTEFHPKLHFLTHQSNEPFENNAYKATPLLISYLCVIQIIIPYYYLHLFYIPIT